MGSLSDYYHNIDMSEEKTTQIVPSRDKDELQAKIIHCADTIYQIHQAEVKAEQTVKEQFKEILDDAMRLGVDKDEVRRMLHEALSARGPKQAKISESYMKKLLPTELKYTEFTRLDYVEKQKSKTVFSKEVAAETHRLIESGEDAAIKRLQIENKGLREEIKFLKEKLIEQEENIIEVRGLLQLEKNVMPIRCRINVKLRKFESAEVDREEFNKSVRQEFRNKKELDARIAAARSEKKK